MEKTNNGFHVTYPVMLALVTVFVAAITWGITSASVRKNDAASISSDHNQIQTNTSVIKDELRPAIQNLQTTKADKDDISEIRGDIRDIKALLIQHMDKK